MRKPETELRAGYTPERLTFHVKLGREARGLRGALPGPTLRASVRSGTASPNQLRFT